MTFALTMWSAVLLLLPPSLPALPWLMPLRSRRSSPSMPLPHRSRPLRSLLVKVRLTTCPSDGFVYSIRNDPDAANIRVVFMCFIVTAYSVTPFLKMEISR